jgi:hypothetical protein
MMVSKPVRTKDFLRGELFKTNSSLEQRGKPLLINIRIHYSKTAAKCKEKCVNLLPKEKKAPFPFGGTGP